MLFSATQAAFLDEVRYAVVATLNPDGSIQQSVVWFLREGADLRFGIAAKSIKARNLRHNPHITITIEDERRYLTSAGLATVEPADPDLRYRLAVRYVGPERAAEWVQRRPDVERLTVRVAVRRVYGQGVK